MCDWTSNNHDVYFRNRENKSYPTNLKENPFGLICIFFGGGGGSQYDILISFAAQSESRHSIFRQETKKHKQLSEANAHISISVNNIAAIPFLHHLLVFMDAVTPVMPLHKSFASLSNESLYFKVASSGFGM